jgi:hypothetical protein
MERARATPLGSTFEKGGNFNLDKGFEPQQEDSEKQYVPFQNGMKRYWDFWRYWR